MVAPIAVNDLRATVVDFTTPFYHDYTAVLFRRPDPALHKWKTYFMPFSWQVSVRNCRSRRFKVKVSLPLRPQRP